MSGLESSWLVHSPPYTLDYHSILPGGGIPPSCMTWHDYYPYWLRSYRGRTVLDRRLLVWYSVSGAAGLLGPSDYHLNHTPTLTVGQLTTATTDSTDYGGPDLTPG